MTARPARARFAMANSLNVATSAAILLHWLLIRFEETKRMRRGWRCGYTARVCVCATPPSCRQHASEAVAEAKAAPLSTHLTSASLTKPCQALTKAPSAVCLAPLAGISQNYNIGTIFRLWHRRPRARDGHAQNCQSAPSSPEPTLSCLHCRQRLNLTPQIAVRRAPSYRTPYALGPELRISAMHPTSTRSTI